MYKNKGSDTKDGGILSTSKENEIITKFGDRCQVFFPLKQNNKTQVGGTSIPSDTDQCYDMGTYPRGKLVIINMRTFLLSEDGEQNDPRIGTEKDVEVLTCLFVDLGFIVEIFQDLKVHELMEIMTITSKEDFKNKSCLFVAFLTHGFEKFIDATDGSIEIQTIASLFIGRNLVGKPKILLIQACQGCDYMQTIDEIDQINDGDKNSSISLPAQADFLYAYSSPAGFYSWRNARSGSWFIQILCEVFRKHAGHMDIVRMLTKVNDLLSQRRSKSSDPVADGKRQVNSTVSQLRKEFYFFPPR